jgi:hypothetical protein
MSRIAGVSSGAGFDMDNPGGGLYPGFGSNQPYIGQALLNPLNKKKDDEPNPWDLVKGTQPGGDTGGAGGGSDSDPLKDTLDIASLIPGVGSFASGANALLSASKGDMVGAAQSAAMAIPGIGTAMKGLQLGSKFGKFGGIGSKLGRIGGIFKGSGG